MVTNAYCGMSAATGFGFGIYSTTKQEPCCNNNITNTCTGAVNGFLTAASGTATDKFTLSSYGF